MNIDHRDWHARSDLLHRVLLVLLLVAVALPNATWRDGMFVAGLVLLGIHLECRGVVLRCMLAQRVVRADRPPEPDALGANPNESLPYS